MPDLKVDYNSLPDGVKAYVDASQNLSDVVNGANNRLDGVQYAGTSGEALRSAQADFSGQSNQTIATSSEDQQNNVQIITENMSGAEADVQSDSAKASDLDADIKL